MIFEHNNFVPVQLTAVFDPTYNCETSHNTRLFMFAMHLLYLWPYFVTIQTVSYLYIDFFLSQVMGLNRLLTVCHDIRLSACSPSVPFFIPGNSAAAHHSLPAHRSVSVNGARSITPTHTFGGPGTKWVSRPLTYNTSYTQKSFSFGAVLSKTSVCTTKK